MSEPIFPLPPVAEGTNQIDIEVNDGWLRLEALGREVDSIANSPSVSVDGTVYIVGAAPTGAFSGFDPDDIAIYYSGTWYAWAPVEGVQAVGYLYSGGAWSASGGGGGTPGGSDTQVQFNDGGAFGGDAGLVYNKTTDTITTVNLTLTGLALTAASASGGAGLRLPHGAAPSSPTNGDVWTTTAGMYARINGSTVGPFSAGGGSLTNWTEAYGAGTQATASFTATNAATNVNAALVAKGNAATTAHIPDATTTGGNSRGQYATDWQKSRSGASLVASGNYSTIGGGRNNQTTGADATVPGGMGNSAGGTASFSAGNSNSSTGNYSASFGNTNSAGGEASFAWGFQTNSGAKWSMAGGGNSHVRSMIGARAHASGGFGGSLGDGQFRECWLGASTTNATQTTATSDLSAASTGNTLVLPNTSCYVVKGTVTGRQNSTGDSSAWEFTAFIKRGANAAATAMVVACTPTLIGQDAGAAAWAVAVDADTTTGGLRCRVTGEAAKNIKWSWHIYSSNEVVG